MVTTAPPSNGTAQHESTPLDASETGVGYVTTRLTEALEQMETAEAGAQGNLTDRVHALLRERILSGELPPGTKLPAIEHLAADLGVSRTVAREAIKGLSAQGLLHVVHGHGTIVAEQTSATVADAIRHYLRSDIDLGEVLEVRLALAAEAAARAAERRTEADLRALERFLGHMARATRDAAAFLAAEIAFHDHVLAAAHNSLFDLLAQPLLELVRETRLAAAQHVSALHDERMVLAHALLLERIIARDAEGAARAMRSHLAAVSAAFDQVEL